MAASATPAEPAIAHGTTLYERYPAAIAQRLVELMQMARAQGGNPLHEFALTGAEGDERHHEARVALIDGQEALVLVRDITARKDAERQVAQLAYFDNLTGLPNRRAFVERLGRELRRAQHAQRMLGVLFMNLDGFKKINDSLGRPVGDLILQQAAERLRQTLRPSDLVSREGEPGAEVELARLGGDEFTVLVPDIVLVKDALAVARRIGEVLQLPFRVEGREVALTSSIGIAMYPDDGSDAETLLEHADTAMHHAKLSSRGSCQPYSAQLTVQAMQRMELDSSLRNALAAGELHVVYQPKVNIASGRIHSVEALLRWTHPTRGPISPAEFIPLAEENGQILAIGLWVLRTACADAARWQSGGHAVSVAVNLSPVQFKDADLVRSVFDILARTPLAAGLLELEITEGAVLDNTEATIATLEAFRDGGVRIALDDFGTGYSSLSYLTRMPIGNLKIDRSFVTGLDQGGESTAIVRAIVAMATSLGVEVTAEGVETLAQAQALKAMDCDTLQGYYFSRPVPAPAIPALLGRRWPLDGLAAACLPAVRALTVASETD
jgi:diguanylate cyclase (GGDEF)-like protein